MFKFTAPQDIRAAKRAGKVNETSGKLGNLFQLTRLCPKKS